MGDQKPPRLAGGGRETILALLQCQRDWFVKKVDGVSEEAARQSQVASGTNLLWLMKHMARAESLRLLRHFAGLDGVIEDDQLGPETTCSPPSPSISRLGCALMQSWQPHRASVSIAGM